MIWPRQSVVSGTSFVGKRQPHDTGGQMQQQAVVFGEVLFDVFPDGSRVLGGAPFNVAWHLQGFGCQPLLLSRLGIDDSGEQVMDAMRQWGLATDGLQHDSRHPTGQVTVSLRDGQPEYEIVTDQAYDFIAAETALATLARIKMGLFYHGSLALRGAISRAAYEAICQHYSPRRCVDVNLRPPSTELNTARVLLQDAYWAKLNDIELAELAGSNGHADLKCSARTLYEKYSLQHLVLTCGEEGAMLLCREGWLEGIPVPVDEVTDTVGAGDAFSSVALLGILSSWSAKKTLACALEFASLICTVRGATINDRQQYQDCLQRWQARAEQ